MWFLGVGDDDLARQIEQTGASVVQGTADPLIELALAQRLAVHTAEQRGLDPDNPRHLTRSIVLS